MTKLSGLGAGLGALFGNYQDDMPTDAFDKKGNLNKGVSELDINLVIPNPDQPRKNFEPTALEELAQSLEIHGILQPILVTKRDNKYHIIAGERRYRAAKIAKLATVPCVIKELSDKDCKEIALIENLQREDLNPIEEAEAIKALLDEFNISQENLAKRLGKSRPSITNALRLLAMDARVIALVRDNRLSQGHAKAIAAIKNHDVQYKYAMASCDKKMSVRQVEMMVTAYLNPSKSLPKKEVRISAELKSLVNDMQHLFATKVKAVGSDEKGRIFIDYYTKDDLQRIFDIIEASKKG